jgi:uncharacterized protein
VAGLAGGLFGVGGGIILVPLLTSRFRLTQHQAHGTSLAIVGATALIALVVYAAHGNVRWITALVAGAASAASARFGARLAARTPAKHLSTAFATLLVVVAVRMLWGLPETHGAATAGAGPVGLALALGTGVLVGMLAGYMGVGGGIIAVPAFTLLLGMSQQEAQGTSLAVILISAPIGALEHHRLGNVALRLVPLLGLGAALGGPIASLFVQKLPQAVLTRAFGVFLIANAVHMILRARRAAAAAQAAR